MRDLILLFIGVYITFCRESIAAGIKDPDQKENFSRIAKFIGPGLMIMGAALILGNYI